MKNQGNAIICTFVTVFMLLMPNYAFGEWFGDIYLGMYSSQADDMLVKFNGATVKTYPDSDTGSIFGGRIGYWFESNSWLGLALDASASELDSDNIVIGIGSFSTLLMLRLSLNSSEEFPKGRIQPYLGVGPGFFFGGMSEFIAEIPSTVRVLDDTYYSVGFDARFGISALIKKSYGLFLEYGFKRFSPSFDSDVPGGTVSLEPTFSTHNFSVGISFRF
jgi:opacity protein-like surface antigen